MKKTFQYLWGWDNESAQSTGYTVPVLNQPVSATHTWLQWVDCLTTLTESKDWVPSHITSAEVFDHHPTTNILHTGNFCVTGLKLYLYFYVWNPRGNQSWRGDLSSVSFISPRQIWDLCETKVTLWMISPVSQLFLMRNKCTKSQLGLPVSFKKRSPQALN